MVFSEKTYSILIVSSNEKFNNVINGLLPVNEYWPIVCVKTIEDARRLFFDKKFDLVLINSPLPDHFGDGFACDVCDKSDAGVLLLSGSDHYEEVCYKTGPHGVRNIPKPVTGNNLKQTLKLAAATLERIRRVMKRQDTVDEKIEEMRIVNKAKWMLIDHAHMTEPESHRFIEKKAMDERMTKREVAKRIISQYEA